MGFTLVELIIVIAVLGILTATVALSLTKYLEKARKATCIHNMQLLEEQMQLLGIDNMMNGGLSVVSTEVFHTFEEYVKEQGGKASVQNNSILIRDICPSGGSIILFINPVDSKSSIECSRHTATSEGFYYQSVSIRNLYDNMSTEDKKALLNDYGISGNENLSNDRFLELFAAVLGSDNCPAVPQNILEKTEKNKNTKLYLHTYFIPEDEKNPGGKILYYATTSQSITKPAGDKWNAYLIYNEADGMWYENVSAVKYGISQLHGGTKTYDSIMSDLQTSQFKVVG